MTTTATIPATSTEDKVKLLVRGLYDTQKLRIQLQLRIDRLIREGHLNKEEATEFFELPFSKFTEAEAMMEKEVWKHVRHYPIVKQWLGQVKGVGPRLAGLLVANIAPISRFDTISKLWAYAGLHTVPVCPECGTFYRKDEVVGFVADCECGARATHVAAKRRVGAKAKWNAELKVTAWKLSGSFLKAGGPYRGRYDRYKARIIEREVAKGNIVWGTIQSGSKTIPLHWPEDVTPPAKAPTNPDWTVGRIHNMALRYIAKLLLSHLWQVWREMEGLPCRPVYAYDYLDHQQQDNPWAYIGDGPAEEEAA